jgi:hypothetical protein
MTLALIITKDRCIAQIVTRQIFTVAVNNTRSQNMNALILSDRSATSVIPYFIL